ncbi:MAG: sugar transferase [Rickettsiales bacterium]|nr:sugar transferase [Rickettsiales bacterium]
MLNHLPSLLRGPAFYLLAALRPTLHITTLNEKLLHLLAKSTHTFENVILVTDGQACNPAFQILKRLMDLSFAVSVILFLWWALVAVWLAVRLSSPGPVIFAQRRVGRFGKPFTCYKFRTMFITTKQAATHEVGRDSITPVGRFLRRTKLDELPQIINIIRNEMSLIGPRPCLESQTALIEARRVRGVLDIKPGISGLAQVQGVDMSDPETLATLDAEYLARQSIMLDVKIMLATLRGNALTDRTKR